MSRKNPHERQDRRDVERAAKTIADAHGLTGAQGIHALQNRATRGRISLHAAALAALCTNARDERWREAVLARPVGETDWAWQPTDPELI